MGERAGVRKRTSEKEKKKREREERDMWNREDKRDTDIFNWWRDNFLLAGVKHWFYATA